MRFYVPLKLISTLTCLILLTLILDCGLFDEDVDDYELKVEILGEGEGKSVKISQHPDQTFNRVYKVREGLINGRPWYQNDNNRYLYFYDQAEGGEKSWSLDHRQPDGNKDWFSGGWTLRVEGLMHPQPGITSWIDVPNRDK